MNMPQELLTTSAASGIDFHLVKDALFFTDTDKRKVFKRGFGASNSKLKDSGQPNIFCRNTETETKLSEKT